MRKLDILYINDASPSDAYVLQELTSQIKGIYTKKSKINNIKDLNDVYNPGIYFLFSHTEDESNVYVGKTQNGLTRVMTHIGGKEFWTECFLFVTDNNSFNMAVVDYLEYLFINDVKKSTFFITNKDFREKEPIVTEFDRPFINNAYQQILFLLSSQKIVFTEKFNKKDSIERVYDASKGRKATLAYEDGKFIVLKGSELRYPIESSREWSDGGRFHRRFTKLINDLIDQEKAGVEDGTIILYIDYPFDSASPAAEIVSGYQENGYLFWKGLDEIRVNENDTDI